MRGPGGAAAADGAASPDASTGGGAQRTAGRGAGFHVRFRVFSPSTSLVTDVSSFRSLTRDDPFLALSSILN